jgi:hypothetical protein
MKSQGNRTKTLQFPWDPKGVEVLRTIHRDSHEKQDFEDYMNWLEEFKPGLEELGRTKIFGKLFTLNQ